MKKEIRCLYCGAPKEKIIVCEKGLYFCRNCDKLFSEEEEEIECGKCGALDSLTAKEKERIDQFIFECKNCEKRYGKKDITKLKKQK